MKKSHGNDAFETDKLIERTCTQCQKEFTNKSVLARHIKTVHEQERPFKCDHCLKHFFNNNQLQVKSLCISHAVSNLYYRLGNLRMKIWCLQIYQKVNQIFDRAEICLKFGWLLGDLKTPKFHSEIN